MLLLFVSAPGEAPFPPPPPALPVRALPAGGGGKRRATPAPLRATSKLDFRVPAPPTRRIRTPS